MVRCAWLLRDRRHHPSRPRRSQTDRGAVYLARVFVLSAPPPPRPQLTWGRFPPTGSSTCPPADKIIGELAKDPSIVALSMPIDYWDYLGWKDTLADARFSARQKAYSRMRGDRDVYTPQAIVNGSAPAIGSDRTSIERAIHETEHNGVMSVP